MSLISCYSIYSQDFNSQISVKRYERKCLFNGLCSPSSVPGGFIRDPFPVSPLAACLGCQLDHCPLPACPIVLCYVVLV